MKLWLDAQLPPLLAEWMILSTCSIVMEPHLR
jgi:predicted nuclease of predicted toxin-antitoxin system